MPDPMWTDAECNKYIVKFFVNGVLVGVLLAVLVWEFAK